MGIFWEKKNKEDGKKSRFLHEIPNEGGRFSIEFVRYFLNAVLLNLSGQNLMQIYGQKLLLGSFVRNRLFSSRPFTDSVPFFIDLSVNGSDFAKCSAR